VACYRSGSTVRRSLLRQEIKVIIASLCDDPGIIGLIGTVLGNHDVNIAGMFNASEVHGGEALPIYNLDEDVPDAVICGMPINER